MDSERNLGATCCIWVYTMQLLFPQIAHQHISSKHNKTKTFPKENFQTSCQEETNPRHSLSYYTNFYCLNVVSLPTSFSAAFLWNYSMAFSRWENPRSRRKTHIISIHKLIRSPTETVLIIYLQKHEIVSIWKNRLSGTTRECTS